MILKFFPKAIHQKNGLYIFFYLTILIQAKKIVINIFKYKICLI